MVIYESLNYASLTNILVAQEHDFVLDTTRLILRAGKYLRDGCHG